MAQDSLHGLLPGNGLGDHELVRTLIDSLPDYVFVKDVDGRFVMNNTEHLHALGAATQQEIAGKTDFDVFPGELAARYFEDEQEVIRTGRPLIDQVEPVRDHSGHEKWLSTTKVPLRDSSGVVIGLLGVSRDITKRKETEEALQNNRARFRAIFDTAAIGMALVDAEGRIIVSNPALQKMLGYDAEDLHEMNFADVTHPEDLTADTERFEQLVAGRLDHFQLEKRYIRKDGSVMWGHLTSSAVRSASGVPWFVVGMVVDITERKEAEAAVERLRRRNELILDSAAEGIYGLDREGRTTFVNPAAAALIGFGPEEVLGKHQHDLIHHSHPDGTPYPKEECPIHAALRDGEVHRVDDEVFWRKDGTQLPVEYTSTPIHEGGEIVGAVVTFRDITERKQTEETLKENEERFRAVVEAQTELVCRFLPDLTLTFVNEAYCRYFGGDPEELIGRSFIERVPVEDRVYYEEQLAWLNKENPRRTIEHRVLTPGGEVRWQQWTDTAIFDGEGHLVEYQSVGRDITERKAAEKALKESEERYRAVVEQSVESIYLYDAASKRVLESNAAFQRLIGYTSDELLETKIYDFIAHDKEDIDANVERSLREGRRRIGERRYRRKDGSVIVVDTSASVVSYGGRTAICAVSRDLTERKQAEEQLRQSEERYRRLVELSPEMIAVHCEGKVVFINAAGARFLGASSPAEVIGKPVMDFVHPNYRELVRSRVRQTQGEHRITDLVQEKFLRLDGQSVDVEVVSAPISYLGKPATQVVARNITDRTEAERRLRDSEELHRAVVEQTVEGIYLGDAETKRVIDSNAAFQRMLGYTAEEIRGMHIYEFVAHDTENIDSVFKNVLDNRKSFIGERHYRRKDGSILDVETSAIVISYGEREVLCTVVRDITERKRAEEALKESEERYRAVVEQSAESIWLFDLDTKEVLESNTTFQEMLGYTAEELSRMTNYDFVAHDREDIDSSVGRVVQERRGFFGERKYRRKDGTVLDVEVSGSVIPYKGKEVVCGVARDLTERKRAEMRLREAETRYRTLVEQVPAVTYIQEVGNLENYQYISPQVEGMLGYAPEECTSDPRHFATTLHPDDRERVLEERRRADETGEPFQMEYKQVAKDGRVLCVRDEATLVRDDEGEASYWQGILVDITEQKTLEERLMHRTLHDPLTGLANRMLFIELLQNALGRAGRNRNLVAVLFVDLDNFKVINDSLGHSMGNELLKLVAKKLRTCVRPGDTVARLFGDEFAILLENVSSANEATQVADRIAEEMRAPFILNRREIFVSASIGIDFGATGQREPDDLLRNADLAMYAAKSRGKAKYETYTPSMNTRVIERLDLENDLRRGIERGEFVVYYQPIVSIDSGRIESLEALVRWDHPTHGLITPSKFLLVAEQTGLIFPIGQWVLEEACRQGLEWQEQLQQETLPIISVNLSTKQFFSRPELVTGVLQSTGLDPRCLQLEITERTVMDDADFSIGKIEKLRGLGIKFAVDDFGTGYSCLQYLKSLPVDCLKIDRSFIEGLGQNPEDDAIVSGTVSLGHALDLKVIAEGVGTSTQLAHLQEIGCDQAQGHYFAKPLTAEATRSLLAKVATQ